MNTPAARTDVVIIGAGPVGLFAAFQCGMHGLACHVIDAQPAIGGQCAALYPEKPIYDIPGFRQIAAARLIARLRRQAEVFGPVYQLGESARDLQALDGGRWRVVLASGRQIEAGAVIIAAGAGPLIPNRLPLPGADTLEGRNVHYSVRERSVFAGKDIVIAGGGDSAADWAVDLASIAASVTCIHRRESWRAAPHTRAILTTLTAQGRVRILAPARLVALKEQDGALAAVEVCGTDGNMVALPCQHLLLFYGLAHQPGPFAAWGLQVEDGKVSIRAKSCATNLPGVFAAGDGASFPGKLNLILAGFSEAATAARNAFAHCRPGEALVAEHSSARMPEERALELKG